METAVLLKGLRAALEYGMLFWLVYFSVQLAHRMLAVTRADLRTAQKERAGGAAAAHAEAVLHVLSGEGLAGRSFPIGRELSIGRSADNDIVIPNQFVSHHHVLIYRRENQYAAEDLGSRNHTYLNDGILTGRTYLHAGDVLRIGAVSLRFER